MLLLLGSKLVRRLLLAVVLTVVVVVATTAGQVWWTARQDDRPRSDAIVVLGASQYDGRPSPVFRARLEHAHRLYEAGVAPRVITLGAGAPGDRTTEAAAGATYLRERGVRVVALPSGRDTLQSLRALEEEMGEQGWASAVLVTDPWHALRSRRMAEDLGLDVATSPARTGPVVRTREAQARYIARETAAYLYYRVFGRSRDSGPDAF